MCILFILYLITCIFLTVISHDNVLGAYGICTISVFLAVTIDQSRPKFHCIKQLYTPQLSVLFTVHTIVILVTIRISINYCRSDWRGQGRIQRGAFTHGHLWM